METILSEDLMLSDMLGHSIRSATTHILVADDDGFSRALLCKQLRDAGYEVTEVANGQDCLQAYKAKPPNLVLLDAMMPGMNGFDCCVEILKQPNSQYTPILMITGLEDPSSVDWAFQVGATDYITKPIHWPVLRHRVRILLERLHLQQSLEKTNLKLSRLATIDPLTDLANRRLFTECLKREWRRLTREGQPLSLLMIDVDCFKNYNDTYGHQAGDQCLYQIAIALQKWARRPADLVARYGGEEFSVILPNTPLAGALCVGEAMLNELKLLAIPHQTSVADSYVTISIGAASMQPSAEGSHEKLISAADEALYRAKQRGRNQVVSELGSLGY